MDETNPMRRIAYDAIAEIIDLKQDVQEPALAHISEIRNSLNVELMDALRGLYREGVLACHLDINKNPMFSINRPL